MRRKISILVLALIPAAAHVAGAEETAGSETTGARAEIRTPLTLTSNVTRLGELNLTGTSERGLFSLEGGVPLGTYDHHEVRVTGRRSNNYFGVYGDSTQPFSGGTGSRGYGFMIGGAF